MSNILKKIIENKKLEVRQRIISTPVQKLEESPFFDRNTVSMKESLGMENSSGIIAEFKRMSPLPAGLTGMQI